MIDSRKRAAKLESCWFMRCLFVAGFPRQPEERITANFTTASWHSEPSGFGSTGRR
jgi:hypothetical protein